MPTLPIRSLIPGVDISFWFSWPCDDQNVLAYLWANLHLAIYKAKSFLVSTSVIIYPVYSHTNGVRAYKWIQDIHKTDLEGGEKVSQAGSDEGRPGEVKLLDGSEDDTTYSVPSIFFLILETWDVYSRHPRPWQGICDAFWGVLVFFGAQCRCGYTLCAKANAGRSSKSRGSKSESAIGGVPGGVPTLTTAILVFEMRTPCRQTLSKCGKQFSVYQDHNLAQKHRFDCSEDSGPCLGWNANTTEIPFCVAFEFHCVRISVRCGNMEIHIAIRGIETQAEPCIYLYMYTYKYMYTDDGDEAEPLALGDLLLVEGDTWESEGERERRHQCKLLGST